MAWIEGLRLLKISRERLLPYAVLGGIAATAAWLFYDDLLPALLAVPAFPALSRRYDRSRADRRRRELENQFRDLLLSLGASFATGRDLEAALPGAEDHLCRLYGDSRLAREIRSLIERSNQSGEPIRRTMEHWAKESGSPAIREFMEVYCLCEETGADRGVAAGRAARLIADAIRSEQAFQMQTAQKRLELRIMAAIPVLLLLLLRISSNGYVAVLYGTRPGQIVMTASLALMAVSYLWSNALLEKGRA